MEPIAAYFTKEGWKNDLQKTREDMSISSKTDPLEQLVRKERGISEVGCLVLGVGVVVSAPFCAYFGSFLGEGLGYITGNIMEMIPYIKNIAPSLAERTGLIQDAATAVDVNENVYRIAGAISGFWGGLGFPAKVALHILKKKE